MQTSLKRGDMGSVGGGCHQRSLLPVGPMIRRWCFSAGLLGLSAILIAGCEEPRSGVTDGEQPIVVFTSIVPQEFLVQRIGGKYVEVHALVRPGSSPATYEPTPRQMAALSDARLYFRIGVPFENAFLSKIETTMKRLRIVDTRKGIELREIAGHSNRGSGATEHDAGRDPHIWLSPCLAKVQSRTMTNALVEIDPEHKEIYEANLAELLQELNALDAQLAATLAPVRGKSFLVFHPSWGYFADDYGLIQETVEVEGKEPSARQLSHIIELAKQRDVRVVFVQPQFGQQATGAVAKAIDGAVIPIDPLAGDYIDNLEVVADKIRAALEAQK
ncbi:metal ABC transporter solute-binding protein, Zn/Mn family [Crateriforma spongiae]|uniref:metal ABC transporter solute-binding protein, Zn/Mn family n=1 Tax=Crateriforma spongiae TaxID=2724528 RepID=UPI00197CD812|nr:zinc ABC transporter substrate-binding protein [Crateriforma spongiae]